MCSQRSGSLEDLIAESRRIQDALIRVAVKLDIFADQLAEEAAKLREVTADGRVPDSEAAQDDAAGGASGGSDGRTPTTGGGES